MANSSSRAAHAAFVTLHDVSLSLPDGRQLLRSIDEHFGAELVGLVGRNGSGKSCFGALLAGHLTPSRGRIQRNAVLHRVDQEIGMREAESLAALAGLAPVLEALDDLERGALAAGALEEALALIADRWDLRPRWQTMLTEAGLAEPMPPTSLSGGQRTLLALIGAFCSEADFLVLDEPSNHLDLAHRGFLRRALQAWKRSGKGALLISHDRALLEDVDRIIAIHEGNLQRYGGNGSFYAQQRQQAAQLASQKLEQARHARRRMAQDIAEEKEREQRRASRGERLGREGRQSLLFVKGERERAEHTAGARRQRHDGAAQAAAQEVTQAFAAAAEYLARPSFHQMQGEVPTQATTLCCEGLLAPWAWTEPLDWTLRGPARVAISGPNGCGKSTLLRLIAGRLSAARGRCETPRGSAYLDQSLTLLDDSRSATEQLRGHRPRLSEGETRQWLAHAGLTAAQATAPLRQLSGGERIKAALCCAVYALPMPAVLLLDEPTNHLDLDAIEAVETLLQSWSGALIVVSHDETFLARLNLDKRLRRAGAGWALEDWAAAFEENEEP
ncbi:ATP-binding cassette domain-containing protein [Niveibacterium sp. SC-1]|uniref:ATP-binding cassette domain-containing protein n=1 Tax=Niveibacterium sp. SC-1 TaxID=3135646 RepID=UPI00311E1018